jgi:hypothetical protein
MEEHGAVVDQGVRSAPGVTFYGLGWDLLAGQFKVYFHARQLEALAGSPVGSLIPSEIPRRSEGLVSFTVSQRQLYEQKVYVYPAAQQGGPGGILHRAVMSTSRRGLVPQYDVSDPAVWMPRLNAVGRRIVQRYADADEALDTIAYTDADHFTLYFP